MTMMMMNSLQVFPLATPAPIPRAIIPTTITSMQLNPSDVDDEKLKVFLRTLSRNEEKRLIELLLLIEGAFDRPYDMNVDKNWSPNLILPNTNGQTAKEYAMEKKRLSRSTEHELSPFSAMERVMVEHPTVFQLELHDRWNPQIICGGNKALDCAIRLIEKEDYPARKAVVCVMFEFIELFYDHPPPNWDIGTNCGPKGITAFKIGKAMIKNGTFLDDALRVTMAIMNQFPDSFHGQEEEPQNQQSSDKYFGESNEVRVRIIIDASPQDESSVMQNIRQIGVQNGFDPGIIHGACVLSSLDSPSCQTVHKSSNTIVNKEKKRSSNTIVNKEKKRKRRKVRSQRVLDESCTIEKTDHDILFGRGKMINKQPGNIYFRRKASELLPLYILSSKEDKQDITRRLIGIMKGEGRRFLAKGKDFMWHEVVDGAFSKASQAFRDLLRIMKETPGRFDLDHGTYNMVS